MNTRTEPHARPLIAMAVYGTLKEGRPNHQYYCAGAVSIQEVTVRGQLYELPSGIPILRVPAEDVLATGTRDPLADVATQERLAGGLIWMPGDDWDSVQGELMTFEDPETRLPRIDCLEGFRPGRASLYRRVLVPVLRGADVVPAWCYVADGFLQHGATPTGKTSWP